MTRSMRCASLFVLLVGVIGCAGGTKYQKAMEGISAPAANHGRIFFYRSGSPVGSAVQPKILLNGQAVGKSVPGGFFYVDQPAGDCAVSCQTEAKRALNFTIAPGETRYVRTAVKMGVLVGQLEPSLEDEAKAKKALEKCKYTGEKQV